MPRYIPDGSFGWLPPPTKTVFLFSHAANATPFGFIVGSLRATRKLSQSSWSVWTFDEAATILNVDVVESTVWFVIERPDVWLESLNLEHGRQGHEAEKPILLDRLTASDALRCSYDATTDLTTVILPWNEPEALDVIAVTHPTLVKGSIIPHQRVAPNTITLRGDHASGGFVVGRRYRKLYRFSPLCCAMKRSEAARRHPPKVVCRSLT